MGSIMSAEGRSDDANAIAKRIMKVAAIATAFSTVHKACQSISKWNEEKSLTLSRKWCNMARSDADVFQSTTKKVSMDPLESDRLLSLFRATLDSPPAPLPNASPYCPPPEEPSDENTGKRKSSSLSESIPADADLTVRTVIPRAHLAEMPPSDPTPTPAKGRTEMEQELHRSLRRLKERREEGGSGGGQGQRWVDPTLAPRDREAMGHVPMEIHERRVTLPVYKHKGDLLEAVRANPVIIVVGETGSGKTTQIPQYLHEEGFTSTGMVCCTQPRRVAATSIARRVAEEVGCRLSSTVGYSIRFDDKTSPDTRIKFATDGMLLREVMTDPLLSRYSVVMLDEAHERTINTDILFALLREISEKRSDFRLIISSATLDSVRFGEYFNSCPIFRISGVTHAVEIIHAESTPDDYLEAAVEAAFRIHCTTPADGDILMFLTGQEDITAACSMLRTMVDDVARRGGVVGLLILPIYSALPSETQQMVFRPAPEGFRKCVISTNIAEASITIDGIVHVIDAGFVKEMRYNHRLQTPALLTVPISRASAVQRAGRCGRTRPGTCHRLYTAETFAREMAPTTVPEIRRANVVSTVLTLKAIGVTNVAEFPLMDPLPAAGIKDALTSLYWLGAIDDEGLLTGDGQKMAAYPVDPHLGRMILAGADMGCLMDVVTVIGLLSVENIFQRPAEKQAEADAAHARLVSTALGDHESQLRIFQTYVSKPLRDRSRWCNLNFLSERALSTAHQIAGQLADMCRRQHMTIGRDIVGGERFKRALVHGIFMQTAQKTKGRTYRVLLTDQLVVPHPASAIGRRGARQPHTVVFSALIQTSQTFMTMATEVPAVWLVEAAPRLFSAEEGVKRGARLEGFSSNRGSLAHKVARYY